jgi:hypothetical protein
MKKMAFFKIFTYLFMTFSSINASGQISDSDTEITLEFYRKYDGIRKVSLTKKAQKMWYKTTTYVGGYGPDSIVSNPCIECASYISDSFIRNLVSIKTTEVYEPCVLNKYLFDSVGNPHILRQTEMVPSFMVKATIVFEGKTVVRVHEDPVKALTYCPYQKERMKMLIAMKTILAVN